MLNLLSIRQDPENFKKFFAAHDRLGSLLGAKLVSLDQKECVYAYDPSPQHYNPNGILHGGALYTVMDSSQGAFVHFILEEKYEFAATGTATIRYEAPVTSGMVRIRTWLKDRQGRKIFVSSEAKDASGKIVATLEEIWIAIAPPSK